MLRAFWLWDSQTFGHHLKAKAEIERELQSPKATAHVQLLNTYSCVAGASFVFPEGKEVKSTEKLA
ncbi:hypothetical protein Pyn_35111 [Prunus yedoensis var. nudiflora]|uniref:Uncharacterized protein n=1 Tax=Prunus yedoensis var. nudiflora TaxID=2094558 RepID=A0A314ZIR1_PRUYE|nr:hypothetical protein Pyn_35111 [Prunus yedoensis var. nudiflora]